jgi:RNA polymerase primary sigma factor
MAALASRKRTKNSYQNELSGYYRQISKRGLLTADEEKSLARRIRSGDESACQELAEANLRLVVKLARKFRHPDLTLADLVQEGNLGLMEAVKKFDPDKGCRFSTYACWWIRQAITRAIANKGRTIRLPVHINELLSKYRKLNNRVRSMTGSDATIERAASEILPVDPEAAFKKARRKYKTRSLGPEDPRVQKMMSRLEERAQDKLKNVLSMSMQPVSLEIPVGEDSDSTLKDLLPGETDLSTPRLDRDSLAWLLSHLSDKERNLLGLRYGFDGGNVRTFAELAEIFGVSRESIRQQELRALKKLRDLATQAMWN